MEITRINDYSDTRFSENALNQHGCFLVDGEPYEVEISSDHEAVIRGRNWDVFEKLIEEFRFYAPHITVFYDKDGEIVKSLPPERLLTVKLEDIQPSQFYVDEEKVRAVMTFITSGKDIIIQVTRGNGRYISLDGHTRLYYAVMKGWSEVRAVMAESDDWVCGFVKEAVRRGVRTPYDLELLSHREYDEKWNRFCDEYFERGGEA